MNWLGWIILGGLAGWVAKLIMKEEGGLLKNIILGIVGGIVGGGLVELLGGSGVNGFNPYSFIVAVLGAVILIYLVRIVTGRKA
ncbi:MAG TPA: GlsB/YeaQ/YmgE family stress response membrane protein [Candidatus Saccharimonadales bacterium]|nr:GlsB/YeaQ/YmgE family stress response membrane protein [Candidatus Saccharimonadales bacterium]